MDHTFASHGLDVELVVDHPGNILHGLAQARYDVCLTTVVHYLKTITAETEALPFVFMTSRRSHMAVYTRASTRKTSHLFSRLDAMTYIGSEDSPDASEPRSEYRRFARELTCEYLALRRRLGFGLPARVVDVPFDDVFGLLLDHGGEVTVDWLDELPRRREQARPRGATVSAASFLQAPGSDVYSLGFVARATFIASRADVIERFRGAIREALEETREDPRPAARAMARRMPSLDIRHAVEAWRLLDPVVFPDDQLGVMDLAGWTRTLEHHTTAHGTDPVPVNMVCGRDSLLSPVTTSTVTGR